MIFVTVGTSHYDPLIREMDGLVASGRVPRPVVAQIGRGQYVPQHMRYYRFLKSLQPAYDAADLVVSTGGAGTTIECVRRGLRLVVVENESLMERHQAQLIGEMARRGHLLWCRRLDDLADCVHEALSREFPPFVSDPPDGIRTVVLALLHDD